MNNCFGLTDRGTLRPLNEDSFCIVRKDNATLGVVCDGIGGNKAGEIASALACRYLQEDFEKQTHPNSLWLHQAIVSVNLKVYLDSVRNPDYQGMGTTMVCFLHSEGGTWIGNVGDSRGYIIDSSNRMVQITFDHTLVNELVKNRGIDEKTASQLVGKNVINRAIGIVADVQPDIFELKDYKSIMICSDGIHSYCDEAKIRTVLLNRCTPEEKCNQLINLSLQAGGLDNATVIIAGRD